MTYRFGCYVLQEYEQQLMREGERAAITSKVLMTLVVLVRAQGKVVTREELLRTVWPDSFVEQGSLAQNIFVLRKLLGPDFPDGNPIETLPRVGYRFREPVVILEETEEGPGRATGSSTASASAFEASSPVTVGARDQPEALALQGVAPLSPAASQAIPSRDTGDRSPIRRSVFKRSLTASARRMARSSLVVGLLLVGAVVRLWSFNRASEVVGTQPALEVSDFRSLTADPAQTWIGISVAELLKSRLAFPDQAGRENGDRSPLAFLRAGLPLRHKRNRFVLTGNYLLVGDQVRLDSQLEAPLTHHAPSLFSVHGEVSQLAEMTATLADEVGSQMGRPKIGSKGDVDPQLLSPEGARFYAEGLRAFTRLNLPVARVLLERATQSDPGSALAHLSLAQTWSALGNEADARKETARAIALGRMVSAETRLRILATAAALSGQWDQAVRLHLTLANCWPNDQAYGVDLANALHQDRRDQEAKRILNSLHGLPAEEELLRQLALCEVDDALGDFQDEADTALKVMAASQAGKEGAPLARASLYRAGALEQLGQLEPASQLFVQAQTEADAAGDTATMMRASIGHAIAVAQTGRPVAAAEQLQQTLALARRAHTEPEQLRCLLALAAVYRETKALDLSLAASGQAIGLAQQLGRQRDLAAAHLNLGQTEIYLGHTAKAREELDDALAQASATSDAPLKVGALGTLGQLDYMQGDLQTSSTLLQQAVQIGVSAGGRELAARYMGQLSQVLSYQGRDAEAMQVLDHLCTYARSARNSIYLLNCELYQSQANEQAGHDQVAKEELEHILETSHDPLVTSEAYRQLALTLLDQGDVIGARSAIGKAQRDSRGMLNEEDYLIPIGIVAARVEAASGELQPALAHLSTLQQRARDLNVTELELEAEYASDETEMGLDASRATRDLQAFQVKAKTLGFLSFAMQADERVRQRPDIER